ncbi:MAG: tRNA 2-thiocytidine(32) synthetase TtcA [Spirochaetia bacterium]|nr:tRNA 2-thiocytidine(32) synthetase TtcA [Spirochaetia bacterium]MCI7578528.1 tRNA 2-thiocytidine(32) synthetase TtcA [Spirochaetia bacterium]
MTLQKLYSYSRQCIQQFDLIQEGDRITLGISGGKDSLALLYAMAGLKKFYPKKFEIIAVTADLGFGSFDMSAVENLCRELEVEYHLLKTDIATILKEKVKKGTYCAMCAKLRKGAINNFAKEHGCNKVAYAHHQDDIVETMMLSLIYEGQFYTFGPKTYYKEADITVIRPLINIPESDMKGFRNKYSLPCVKNPCPHDGTTRRQYVKDLVAKINKDNPGVKKKMYNAILKGKIYEWE